MLGGEKPSSTSIRLVLPAPFLPRSPTILPGSLSTEMLLRMAFPPMTLPISRRLITGEPLALPLSIIFLLHFLFDQGGQVCRLQVQLPCREHQRVHLGFDVAQPPCKCLLVTAQRRDGHGLAAVALDQTLELQQPVGLGNRRRIDRVLGCHFAHRGQFSTGCQVSARGQAAHLVDELAVDRHAGSWFQREDPWRRRLRGLIHECTSIPIHSKPRQGTTNVTVDQAHDLAAKTLSGVVLYEFCTPLDQYEIDFASAD